MKATGDSIPLGQGWPGLLAGNPSKLSLLFLNPILKGDLEIEKPKEKCTQIIKLRPLFFPAQCKIRPQTRPTLGP